MKKLITYTGTILALTLLVIWSLSLMAMRMINATAYMNISPDTSFNSVIYLNFTNGSVMGNGYWNNISYAATSSSPIPSGIVFSAFKDSTGTATNVGVKITSSGWYSGSYGATTSNNSGIYPDNVIRSDFACVTPQTFQVFGLIPDSMYSFTFFGSMSSGYQNRSVIFSIGDESDTLSLTNNTTNAVSITDVVADAAGTVTVNVENGVGSISYSINAMVIHGDFIQQPHIYRPYWNIGDSLMILKDQYGDLTARWIKKGSQLPENRILIDLAGTFDNPNGYPGSGQGVNTVSPQPDGLYWNTLDVPSFDSAGKIFGQFAWTNGDSISMSLQTYGEWMSDYMGVYSPTPYRDTSSNIEDYPVSAWWDGWIHRENVPTPRFDIKLPAGTYNFKFWGRGNVTDSTFISMGQPDSVSWKGANFNANKDYDNAITFDNVTSDGSNPIIFYLESAGTNKFSFLSIIDIQKQ